MNSQEQLRDETSSGAYSRPAHLAQTAPSRQQNRSRRHAKPKPGPGPLRRFLRTPKGTVLYTLLLLTAVAAIHGSDRAGLFNIFAAMLTASLIDLLIGLTRRNKRVIPDGGMVTGLIVGLVLSGSVHWDVAALTGAIAVASKHILKIGRKPIFNPAAFALLLTLYAFHTGQSWWGDLADLPVFVLPLLMIAGYFITSRVNKFPQVLTYLGTYFLLLTVAASWHIGHASFTPGDAMRVPLVNAALFMAFFMLTDPPTSPGKYPEQVTFSILAAVVSVAVYLLVGGLAYLLIGLLVANGWRALLSWRNNAKTKATPKKVTRTEYYA